MVDDTESIVYRADISEVYWSGWEWKPSIHMRRKHSRITLEITGVRVERLQAITDEDAVAEGIPEWTSPHQTFNDRVRFHELWDGLYGKRYPWSSSPWVWVVSSRRVTT